MSFSDDEEEMSNTLFHDPSWPEPWTHPEFADPNVLPCTRWRTQPWYRESRGRYAAELIRSNCSNWPWGYVIYRTVYTPESDKLWPLALDKFDRWMHYEIDAESREYQDGDRFPEQFIHESYRNVIISDKDRLDGASVDVIRAHFHEWRRERGLTDEICTGRGQTRFTVCLIIDERALSSLMRSIEPGRKEYGDLIGYCTMVDASYKGGSYCNEAYKGFMRVELFAFWELYVQLDMFSMWELCPHVHEGQIPQFRGVGDGKAVNEDGEELRVEFPRGGRR